jgi:hypothetical protein
MKFILFLFSLISLSGCNALKSQSFSTTSISISGVISAGPISNATVSAYALNSDGSKGALLGTAISDTNGNYTMTMNFTSGPALFVVTNGSYVEEASGSTVSLTNAQIRVLLPSVSANQKIGITPVTEIATQGALTAIATNLSVTPASIISSTNSTVASAMGLTDITVPPANPNQPAAQASNTQAAKYAVVLASISQLAKTASSGMTVNSLDVAQGLAVSFSYNGNFNSTLNSGATNVPVPNSTGSENLSTVLPGGFSAAMASAMTTVVATMPSGYSNATVVPPPTFTTAPPPPNGAPNIGLPPPPATLPTSQPTDVGPPPATAPGLLIGTYKAMDVLCTSLAPCMQSIDITSATAFTAHYLFLGAIPVVQTGTYIYSQSQGGLVLTQATLIMTPGTGQASQITCTGLTLADNQATSIAGKTCSGMVLSANGSVTPTNIISVNPATMSACNQGGMITVGEQCQYNSGFSYVLQTPLTAYTTGGATLVNGTYTTALTPEALALGLSVGNSANYVPILNSFTINGSAVTATSTIFISANLTTQVGTITQTGSFTKATNGHLTFTMQSIQVVPLSSQSSSFYANCPSLPALATASTTFTGASCGGITFPAVGSALDTQLSVVSSKAVTLCTFDYVNCQFDVGFSYKTP